MQAFPRRTLLLMVLALAAFVRLWCATHPSPPKTEPGTGLTPVQLMPRAPSSDASIAATDAGISSELPSDP